MHEVHGGREAVSEIARAFCAARAEFSHDRVPRHALRIFGQLHHDLLDDRPRDAEFLGPVPDFCSADDIRGLFGIVALNMRHQENAKADRFAVDQPLAALLLRGPSQDMLGAAVETRFRIAGEAAREFRANFDDFDESVDVIGANG